MSRFNDAHFLTSAAAPAQFPPDLGTEVAFTGRSNAGKSSAINAITQRQALARTSKTPGRTRLLNFFELMPSRRLVDLPGYGYAQVPGAERDAWVPLLNALRGRAALIGLFMIVDARRGITAGDLELLDWAQPTLRVHVLLSQGRQAQSWRSFRRVACRLGAARGPRELAALFGAQRHRRARGAGHSACLADVEGCARPLTVGFYRGQ